MDLWGPSADLPSREVLDEIPEAGQVKDGLQVSKSLLNSHDESEL